VSAENNLQIPGDQPGERIDCYGNKYFEKRKVLRRKWKTPRETSTSSGDIRHGLGAKPQKCRLVPNLRNMPVKYQKVKCAIISILIISAVKICQQCLQTDSAFRGLPLPPQIP